MILSSFALLRMATDNVTYSAVLRIMHELENSPQGQVIQDISLALLTQLIA
jgi:hypothetical protein